MITKKAAIGFILLALIVFPVAYISWQPPVVTQNDVASKIQSYKVQFHDDSASDNRLVYRAPLVTFKSPLDMAIVVTIIMEVFSLLCYVVLKKLEAGINAAAADAVLALRDSIERGDEEEPDDTTSTKSSTKSSTKNNT